MAEFFQDSVVSGSLIVALPVAVLAGLVSFFSPCVIPLLPGYLSYATGLSGAELEDAHRGRMLAGSVLFVLGFGTVFVALGALSGYFGSTLIEVIAYFVDKLGEAFSISQDNWIAILAAAIGAKILLGWSCVLLAWTLPDSVEPQPIEDHGLLGGRIAGRQLHHTSRLYGAHVTGTVPEPPDVTRD